jgi:arsenical pump membrane protein
MTVTLRQRDRPIYRRLRWVLGGVGAIGLLIAVAVVPGSARSAAGQTWSPFVLVTGLLLIGQVARDDGLFEWAGALLARRARNGVALFAGAAVLVGVITATLNLDTSVVFLTPVLLSTAQKLERGERPLLYGSLMLANASSLLLPGSNLTNLIVLGPARISGGHFIATMWPAALAAWLITATCVGVWGRRDLREITPIREASVRPILGLGVVAVVVATGLVLATRAPALPVLAVGVAAASVRMVRHRLPVQAVVDVLGLPVLIGLFGCAVGLATLGRCWTGPTHLLAHAGSTGSAGLAAAATLVLNTLPAAALLASHAPSHAAALLVGLNLGPNLFVTGSLAWVLWLQAARASGARPSVAQGSRLGLVVVPLSMAGALVALAVR